MGSWGPQIKIIKLSISYILYFDHNLMDASMDCKIAFH